MPLEWPPKKLPKNFPLTVRGDGYCKSINNRVRWICGKITPREAIKRLDERKRAGDFDDKPNPYDRAIGIDGVTVKELCNLFIGWMRQRVETRRPRPLNKRTYDDYVTYLQTFANCRQRDQHDQPFGRRFAELLAAELQPHHFASFIRAIPGTSPYTLSRYVASVKAMYSYADEANLIPHPMRFGPDFRKASADELDAARSELVKSFTVDEIRKLLSPVRIAASGASDKVRARIEREDNFRFAVVLLCLNCAFSNIDIGRLPRDPEILNLDAGIIQFFRREKKGRAWRRCPLWPVTVAALRAYVRPPAARPEYDSCFFLTVNGVPFVRHDDRRDENGVLSGAPRQDSIGQRFGDWCKARELSKKGRSLSGLRTTARTIVDALPAERKDNDAIDIVMGHKGNRHISRQYVEHFPVSKLHTVVDFLFEQLFVGWAMPLSESPRLRAESIEPVADAAQPEPSKPAA